MDALQLRSRQAPLKELYQKDPAQARLTMRAEAVVDFSRLTCRQVLPTSDPAPEAGLHPMAGGAEQSACAGELLLQSLTACAGVTLAAVKTAMGLEIEHARIVASGTMDFRGTLGISRDVPVGLSDIQLEFQLKSAASPEQLDKLIQVTERCCVVLQTLRNSVPITSRRL